MPDKYVSPITGKPICADCGEAFQDCECPREGYEPDEPDMGPTEADEAVMWGGIDYP